MKFGRLYIILGFQNQGQSPAMRFTKPHRRLSGYQAYVEPGEDLPFLEIGEIKARPDWQVPPHTHAGYEIHYQFSGTTRWRVRGDLCPVPERGVSVVAPGVRHGLHDTDRGDVHFAYVVFPAQVVPAPVRSAAPFRTDFYCHDRAHSITTALLEILKGVSRRSRWRGLLVRSWLEVLCYVLASLDETPAVERDLAAHPASLLAKELMEGRPEEDWNLRRLATLAGVSVPHLIALFKADFGATPRRWLLEKRLHLARTRLGQSESSVTSVAMELGFSSGQHLATAWRKHFGGSPREWSRDPSRFYMSLSECSKQVRMR